MGYSDGQARHGRALQAARASKRGSREAEAALLSLDALHKQVPQNRTVTGCVM